ncbi:unnamed protein product [Ambrosiozyma monospora]|uniref:Unnamed protein product n=1 Tax=Ambrosiozyma monospora TaxID=43982 RepID=A0ACB5T7B9_AMBMO|nr:unnamed protein product [Ambrosiozyma monospora]
MIVALRELSIRGDFRTTIEYLINLLETPAFEDNTITTGWLDELITKKLTVERPDPTVAVVCGAVTKAFIQCEENRKEYVNSLEKGQVPSKELLKTIFNVEFIYEGNMYKFTVAKSATDYYTLFINGSRVVTQARFMSDGSLLIALGGKSQTVYWKEEVGATRLSVDSKTCLLEVENDPTQLRSPSPGKLVKYLVEDGDHINAGQPYAEVEVMKMCMPLVAQENGTVQILKQPGSTVNAGDILAILALDDPSKVKHALPFEGTLPDLGSPTPEGSKPVHKFQKLLNVLTNILAGFDNSVVMNSTISELIDVLRDPQLPYSEWQNHISALHSRLPIKLDTQLSELIERTQKRGGEFPAKQILKLFERAKREEEVDALFDQTIEPLTSIANRYKAGLVAHEYSVFANFMEEYYRVESLFSGHNIREEDVILKLRDENKDDLNKVIAVALSHSRINAKNNFIIAVLNKYQETLQDSLLAVETFKAPLKNIVQLDTRATAKATLKAREILIQCSLPSTKERSDQLEHILKSSMLSIPNTLSLMF